MKKNNVIVVTTNREEAVSKLPTRDVVKGALSYHTSQRTEANQELVDEIANAYAEGKLVEPCKECPFAIFGKVSKQEVKP